MAVGALFLSALEQWLRGVNESAADSLKGLRTTKGHEPIRTVLANMEAEQATISSS